MVEKTFESTKCLLSTSLHTPMIGWWWHLLPKARQGRSSLVFGLATGMNWASRCCFSGNLVPAMSTCLVSQLQYLVFYLFLLATCTTHLHPKSRPSSIIPYNSYGFVRKWMEMEYTLEFSTQLLGKLIIDHGHGKFRDTLCLCQNSYWKWPIEIVDFPIGHGDFP